MQKLDGYFPIYWDERTGTLWLEIPRLETDFLYTTGLAAGLGSNDIGLDRGQAGGGRIVSFQRVGPKVLMMQRNELFRSSSANPAERRSVEDWFSRSETPVEDRPLIRELLADQIEGDEYVDTKLVLKGRKAV